MSADPWSGLHLTDAELEADDRALAEMTAASEFARSVDEAAYTLRVREAARDKVAAEKAAPQAPFDAGLLAEILARPQEPPHRVDGLIPSEAATLIVAQRKTGKTTLQLGLARSLILGGEFLGRFPVRPVTGRVGFLNYEVSGGQLARWADQVGVPEDRLYMVNLRGRRNPLILDSDRQLLAEQLVDHEVETLIVDPFGRAYTGKSQNDPGEVSAWLSDLDRFARGDAGVTDLVLSAHAGWDGERTRGASALEDWADSIVTLVRDRDDDRVRYLRAEGRDVEVEEDQLGFDPRSRALTLVGSGSRRVAAKTRRLEALLPAVLELLRDNAPHMSGSQIDTALKETDLPTSKGDGAKAAQILERRGMVASKAGPRNSRLFSLLSSPSSLNLPQGSQTTSLTPLLIGEVVNGEVRTLDLPQTREDPAR